MKWFLVAFLFGVLGFVLLTGVQKGECSGKCKCGVKECSCGCTDCKSKCGDNCRCVVKE